MTVLVARNIALQRPIGLLADRFGSRRVLVLLTTVVVAAAALVPLTFPVRPCGRSCS